MRSPLKIGCVRRLRLVDLRRFPAVEKVQKHRHAHPERLPSSASQTPLQKGSDYRTTHTLPKSDISSATDKPRGAPTADRRCGVNSAASGFLLRSGRQMPTSTAVAPRLFVPPFPPRAEKPRGALSTILTLRRNPLEIWGKAAFEQPFWVGRSFLGMRAMAHDPAAVRHVFLDNAANYRKDELQLRILSPGLGEGLLTAEGEPWRLQRRALAPLFSPREVIGFAAAMQTVATRAVERLLRRRDGAIVDVGDFMSRITLEILEQTLFSQGLGKEPGAFQHAMTRYLDTFGRVDPLDLLGAPAFVPRIGRWRGREALRFFDQAVDDIVGRRRALIEKGGEPPRDLLTLLLAARDPETGQGLPESAIRANIVTFINAGHETTANALTWTLYLLSQAPEWRERAETEADATFDREHPAALERCPTIRAVIEEAMRLYPPVATLSREAIADDQILGVDVPAGTVVLVSPTSCIAGGAFGRIPTPSIRRGFLARGGSASIASPTSHLERDRGSVLGWLSPCRKP